LCLGQRGAGAGDGSRRGLEQRSTWRLGGGGGGGKPGEKGPFPTARLALQPVRYLDVLCGYSCAGRINSFRFF
jgi:hypothetical protein